MRNVEIITIGDELLIGQVIDTNSAWIATQLNAIGLGVKQITSISDNREAILKTLEEAGKRADIILMTGGLGPTKDDITKATLADFFCCGYKLDQDALLHIEALFKRFGKTVSDINRKQAEIPEKATKLHNKNGTAPGMWFEENGRIYISVPGVPFEMKGLMNDEIIPRLKATVIQQAIHHKTILTLGIGESYLADMIKEWEDHLPQNCKLAYLPSVGAVRLRLSLIGNELNELKKQEEKLTAEVLPIIQKFVYGYDQETLPGILKNLCIKHQLSISTAESCTGGLIGNQLVSEPGSSTYYYGGIIAYANEVKINELNVNNNTIEQHGAVSSQTVEEMLQGCLKKFNTDWAIAVSGTLGPDGGTPEKPVGTVYIGVANKDNSVSIQRFQLGYSRERNMQVVALYAMNELRKLILQTTQN